MRIVIAFTGLKGSGKTTAARYLVAEHAFARFSFARGLKDMLRALGIDEPLDKEAPIDLLCGKSYRYAAQTLGTEWGRRLIGEDIWVRGMRSSIEKAAGQKNIVIDDLRFKNEADMVRSLNDLPDMKSSTISICRGKAQSSGDKHQSETEIMELTVDGVLYNNYEVEYLYESIRSVLSKNS